LGTAGQRALDRGDVPAARKLLESAASLLPDDDPLALRLRSDLTFAMAMAGEVAAAAALAEELVGLARASGDEHSIAWARLVRLDSQVLRGKITNAEALEISTELLATMERHVDQRGADRAIVELAQHNFWAGRVTKATAILRARVIDDPRPAGPNLTGWLVLAAVSGPMPISEASRLVEAVVAKRLSRTAESQARAFTGLLLAFRGRFAEAREMVRESVAMRRELGQTMMAFIQQGNVGGEVSIMAQDYVEAEQLTSEAVTGLLSFGERGFVGSIAPQLGEVQVRLGKLDDAEKTLEQARELGPLEDDLDAHVRLAVATALLHLARGNVAAALPEARRAVDVAERTDYFALRGQAWTVYGEALLAAGERATALEALGRAKEIYDAKEATVLAGRLARRLAELEATPAREP
jgi:tetratricopeptide (TPR) repeat protein